MDGEKLMDELNTCIAEDAGTSDDTALPFETLDDYSTDPVSFNEMSLLLLKKVEDVFDYASKYNRHSPQYLKSCVQLEKGIKYLGSCCVTKRALINEGKQSFPDLGQLTTEKLYRMASLHFRKIDRALTEHIAEKDDVDTPLLDMQFRYFNLLQRLRSTETKLYNYQMDFNFTSGRSRFNPYQHGLTFSEKSWTKDIHDREQPPIFGQAKAFPALPGFTAGKPAKPGNDEMKAPEARPDADKGSCCGPADPAPAEIEIQPEDTAIRESTAVSEVDAAPRSTSPELPECVRIMSEVIERSAENKNGSLIFTIEEMEYLAADPVFAELDPQMSKQIKRAIDSG